MPDPEIAQAVAHIPQPDAFTDVEMQESRPPPGFEPEVSKVGYDVNLVRSASTEPGSTSPVTARENQMLDGATEQPPGHLELVSRAPMRTPVIPMVTKSPGSFFLERSLYPRRLVIPQYWTEDGTFEDGTFEDGILEVLQYFNRTLFFRGRHVPD